MTGSVGTDLRHAREQSRLSLLDMSARTKIRIPLLEAIEREQFERLPAGLLMRGYLRAYAREVGLDPESVVRQYLEEFEPAPLPPAPRPLEPLDTEWDGESPGRTRWAVLAPLIPLTLAALFFLLMSRPARVAPVQPPAPAPPAAPVGTTGQAADPLRLDVYPTAPTWIEVSADGDRVLYGLVDTGQRRTLEADRVIALRVGDAGAFAYSINGAPGRPLGGRGEIRDVQITRSNYAEFLTE